MKRIALALFALILLLCLRADAAYIPSPVARKTTGAVPQYTLVKADATTAGRVTLLLTTDSATLVTGIALTASAGTGNTILVMEVQGVQAPIKSDGTGTIAAGDALSPSATSNGRVVKASNGSPVVCSAMQAAVAVADTVLNCL